MENRRRHAPWLLLFFLSKMFVLFPFFIPVTTIVGRKMYADHQQPGLYSASLLLGLD